VASLLLLGASFYSFFPYTTLFRSIDRARSPRWATRGGTPPASVRPRSKTRTRRPSSTTNPLGSRLRTGEPGDGSGDAGTSAPLTGQEPARMRDTSRDGTAARWERAE